MDNLNVVYRCKCNKCGMEFIMRCTSGKRYEVGDIFPHKNCGTAKVITVEEMCGPEQNSNNIGISIPMTDKEIGRIARKIAERGNSAIIKKNRRGIVILEEKCKIIKEDKPYDEDKKH